MTLLKLKIDYQITLDGDTDELKRLTKAFSSGLHHSVYFTYGEHVFTFMTGTGSEGLLSLHFMYNSEVSDFEIPKLLVAVDSLREMQDDIQRKRFGDFETRLMGFSLTEIGEEVST